MSVAQPLPASARRAFRYNGVHCAPCGPTAIKAYALTSFAVIAVYPFLPLGPVRSVAFLIVSCAPLPPVWTALRRATGSGRWPWRLMLSSLVSLNVGNLVWYWYTDVKHLPTADGTASDALISLGHMLMLAGAVVIVVRRGRTDIGGMIDTTIVAMAAGGLLWDVVVLPDMAAASAPAAAQISMFVDILMLTGMLGAMLRLLQTAETFIASMWLLVLGLTLSLVGNVTVAMLLDPVTGARPDWTNMLFMGAYAAIGLVGLHPSTTELVRPGPAPADDLTAGRLAFLGVALASVPVIGGGRELLGRDVDGVLLALGGAAITSLVMVRIGRLAAQKARAERALLHQATHDALTGLPNRRQFVDRLSIELAVPAARRTGPVVLFCDLDGFKGVNDRLGHAAGDQLLIEVAARLRACVRDHDVVSRFGGDEFLILCRDASLADADNLCRRIVDALRQPMLIDSEPVVIGASIGVVSAGSTIDAEQLIQRADEAMYAAKQRRRQVPGVPTVAA